MRNFCVSKDVLGEQQKHWGEKTFCKYLSDRSLISDYIYINIIYIHILLYLKQQQKPWFKNEIGISLKRTHRSCLSLSTRLYISTRTWTQWGDEKKSWTWEWDMAGGLGVVGADMMKIDCVHVWSYQIINKHSF